MDCEKSTYHKCGDIFLWNDKDYSFLCFYCDELLYEFNKFKAHVKNHINESESSQYNILSDFPIESLSEVESEPKTNYTYNNDDCLQKEANESIDLIQYLNNDITEDLKNTTSAPVNNIYNKSPTQPMNRIDNNEADNNNQAAKTDRLDFEKASAIQLTDNYIKNEVEKILNHSKKKKKPLTNIYCLHCKQMFQADSHDFKKCTEMKLAKLIKKTPIPQIVQLQQNIDEQNEISNIVIKENSEGEEYSDDFFENILPVNKLEMPYQCCYCNKLFRVRYLLDNHIRMHTNYRPFQCTLCPSAFTTQATLQKHMVCMHTDERPFVCSYEGCKRKFKLQGPLKQHEKLHRPDSFAYQCEICGKQYKARTPFIEHTYLHTGAKPFQCPKCPKTFRSNKTLWVHKKVHSDVRQYSCKFCDRRFKQLSCLYTHLKKYCQLVKASKANSVNTD